MNIIVQSSIYTLHKSIPLLESLTNRQLSDHSILPYNSCIGSHLRHILDFYDCILEGLSTKYIDLTNRKRDERMHCDCDYTISNVKRVIDVLKRIEEVNLTKTYIVSDNLGLGDVEIKYSLGAVLAQANSHAIHHYAIINYILEGLGIKMEDETFGYNPTTPKPEINLN